MNKIENQSEFTHVIDIIGGEIERSQVRVVVAANSQMLIHYWRIGYIISYCQQHLGWGSKIVEKISKKVKMNYPEKKGYSSRNLMYMCQFAKLYTIETLTQLVKIDSLSPQNSIESASTNVRLLNEFEFTQEPLAQIVQVETDDVSVGDLARSLIGQEPLAQLGKAFAHSPTASINWASHVVLMDS